MTRYDRFPNDPRDDLGDEQIRRDDFDDLHGAWANDPLEDIAPDLAAYFDQARRRVATWNPKAMP